MFSSLGTIFVAPHSCGWRGFSMRIKTATGHYEFTVHLADFSNPNKIFAPNNTNRMLVAFFQ